MMQIAALAGGVGGAKLAHGLANRLEPEELSVVINTGDDFDYLGLHICPDVDTVSYTLAGLANPVTGWGRLNESWNVMQNLVRLGGPSWFNLGDLDLGTHLERTRRLAEGQTYSQVLRSFCETWGVKHTLLPMSDQPVSTWVETLELGWLGFQEYFVRERCQPRVVSFQFRGIEQARPAPGVVDALAQADWIILCPSNPWVSIDPILLVPGMLEPMRDRPIAAVSPIVGGKAIKGPAAKMYQELGIEPSALAVAQHYCGRFPNQAEQGKLLLFIDEVDAALAGPIAETGVKPCIASTVMQNVDDRNRLAEIILAECARIDLERTAGS